MLLYLTTDLTVREIAALLHVSTNTIRTHQQAIYRKLGVGGRREAVRAMAAGGHGEINRWLGRTWEVRATGDRVSLILDGGSPVMTVGAARQLARALLDAATRASCDTTPRPGSPQPPVQS